MGDVWLAHDESLHVDRAVKILHADRTDPAERRRFVEEGRLMAGLGEIQGFVHVHSAGACPATGQPFLVMDALLLAPEEIRRICVERLGLTPAAAALIADADGTSEPRPLTLQDILGNERDGTARQLPERAVLALARDIAAALARLHGRTPPVIHRDIKPANLLFAPDGRIRLGDFGIARELAPGRPGFTRTGLQPGTRRYAAPEQLDGMSPTPAVDWYALGVVLFRALYSSFPEWGEAFPTHSGLRPISPLWEPLLRDLLAKDPAHRLASPAAFLARLDAIERSLSPRPRRRHARAVLIGFLAILGCLGALGTLWFRSKGGSNDSGVSDSRIVGISDSSITSTTEHTESTEHYPNGITRAVPQAGDSVRGDAAERQEDVSHAEDAEVVSHADFAEDANFSRSMTIQDVYTGPKWPTKEPSGPFRKSIEKWRREDEEARVAAAMAGRHPTTRRPLERYETNLYRSAMTLVLRRRAGQPVSDADLEAVHLLREEWEAWAETIDRLRAEQDSANRKIPPSSPETKAKDTVP